MNLTVVTNDDLRGNIDNDGRADMIYPFVIAYRKAYYWHLDDNGEPTEPLGVVVADMIGNLLHLADRVHDDDDDPEVTGADNAWHRGMAYYVDERYEEAERDRDGQAVEEADVETSEENESVRGADRDT